MSLKPVRMDRECSDSILAGDQGDAAPESVGSAGLGVKRQRRMEPCGLTA
ncbi:hypothetical protein [Croceicoccus estronivorus]|nr:hypothetical protein [Croceicoccus estronivorus]